MIIFMLPPSVLNFMERRLKLILFRKTSISLICNEETELIGEEARISNVTIHANPLARG